MGITLSLGIKKKTFNCVLSSYIMHRVSRIQLLCLLQFPPIFCRSSPNFVHLRDNIICYVAAVELIDKALFQISFATFKVLKPNRKYIFWKENLWVDYDFISFSIKFFYRIFDDPDFRKKKPIL